MHVLISLIIVLFHFFLLEEELIVNEKTISVSGQTSLGGFKCDYCDESYRDTLFIDSSRSHSDQELVFEIPVQSFSCGNFLLNRDFRKTIKAEEYPKARIRVKNIRTKGSNYSCDLSVDLAGKKLEYKGLELKKDNGQLQSNLILSFEQLELSTPSKMGGLIKVEEELALEFRLGINNGLQLLSKK